MNLRQPGPSSPSSSSSGLSSLTGELPELDARLFHPQPVPGVRRHGARHQHAVGLRRPRQLRRHGLYRARRPRRRADVDRPRAEAWAVGGDGVLLTLLVIVAAFAVRSGAAARSYGLLAHRAHRSRGVVAASFSSRPRSGPLHRGDRASQPVLRRLSSGGRGCLCSSAERGRRLRGRRRVPDRQDRAWSQGRLPRHRDARRLRDHRRRPHERGLAGARRQERRRPAAPRPLRGGAARGGLVRLRSPSRCRSSPSSCPPSRCAKLGYAVALRGGAGGASCGWRRGRWVAEGPQDARGARQRDRSRAMGKDVKNLHLLVFVSARRHRHRRRDADDARRPVHARLLPSRCASRS